MNIVAAQFRDEIVPQSIDLIQQESTRPEVLAPGAPRSGAAEGSQESSPGATLW